MDRNLWWGVRKAVGSLVALRKESVDRNFCRAAHQAVVDESLSARRAWIEIGLSCVDSVSYQVALRKESVDRNQNSIKRCLMSVVALRKESVDRNTAGDLCPVRCECRSPQGERG